MRYHFHVAAGGEMLLDEEGREMSEPDMREAALKGARSLIAEDVRAGRLDLSGRIEVVDEYGRQVLVVPFRDAVALRAEYNQIG